MTKREKIKVLCDYCEERYGDQKPFLQYNQDYEFLFSVILSAQAKDEVVNKVTKILFTKYPTLDSYTTAEFDDIFTIIKPVGLAKNKTNFLIDTAKKLVDKYDYKIPIDRKELLNLPGVGDKVAGVYLGEIYNFPFLPVDTHIARISKRLNLVQAKDNPSKIEKILLVEVKKLNLVPIRVHKHLISFGRDVCDAKSPLCYECPLEAVCKNKAIHFK